MKARHRTVDLVIVAAVVLLLVFSVLMVFSASFFKAEQERLDRYFYLKRQLMWVVAGLATMFFMSQIQYWHWQRVARPLLILTVVLLLLVLIPGVGILVQGSRRWLGVGSLSFQPSEAAKLVLIMFWAAFFSRRSDDVRRFWPILPAFIGITGLVVGLVNAQPDLGTAVTLAAISVVMLFVAGARLRYLLLMGFAAVPLLAVLIYSKPERMRRIFAFLSPEDDPLGSGYHIIQSLYALGSGHLFGVGYGASRQKFYYLPEEHTDFIFSIIGEELGFLGAGAVLALFAVLGWRGYRVAASAPDTFGALMAAGLTSTIILQTIINIGVVTATLPVTGIPLPLVSYGGSSLLFTMAGIGILLNLSKYVPP